MELGKFDLCLRVKDLKKSTEFYKALGFENTKYEPEVGMSIMKRNGLTFALYDRYITETTLNFRGGDVFKITAALKQRGFKFESDVTIEPDGSQGASLRDPDGNLIYFNTAPGEELAVESILEFAD